MKNLFFILFITLFSASAFGQFQMTHLGNGDHQITSGYPAENMHFYLFGDGYHSFDQHPVHQFHSSSIPADVFAFTSDPYDNDEPEAESVGTANNGAANLRDEAPADMTNIVQIKRSWNLVEGNQNYFLLMVENHDDPKPWNGCVEFHYNEDDSQINTVEIQDQYNGWFAPRTNLVSDYTRHGYTHKFVWQFSDLKLGEQRYIYIPTNCVPAAFSTVKTCGVIKRTAECDEEIGYELLPYIGENQNGSGGLGQNSSKVFTDIPIYELISVVSNFPHDPNLITSECNHYQDDQFTIPYRIYFQNDGRDPVKDVVVDYFTNKPYTNVILDGASHSVEMTWHPHTNNYTSTTGQTLPDAVFTFRDIYLPGTGQGTSSKDFEETIGWVDFRVCYNLIDTEGFRCLTNDIDIYFDRLPPVSYLYTLCEHPFPGSTPKACDETYCPPVHTRTQTYDPLAYLDGRSSDRVDSLEEDLDFQIFPNPAQESLNIELSSITTDGIQATMIDVNNNLILSEKLGTHLSTIDVSRIPAGVYYLRVSDEQDSKVKVFVKI